MYKRQIYASNLNCPPAFVKDSQVENSLISEGTKIVGARIKNSILGRGVKIENDVVIEDSIILDFTKIKKGCRVKLAIIDRFNIIEENTYIGYDKKRDKNSYYVDSSGIVVVKRGSRKIS